MAKPPDLARELEALEERPREYAENEDPPRSKHPALFRAARAAVEERTSDELVGKLADELGKRLTDGPLFQPIVELARDVPLVRERILAALAAQPVDQRWAFERQLALLQKIQPAELALERALQLMHDEPTLDAGGQAHASDERASLLRELVEVRLACPTARRDRQSVHVARGALRLLARAAPKKATALAVRTVEAETRRAGKEDPELALAGIEVLRAAEPLEKLRAARWLEKRIERRVIQDRLGTLATEASEALGATPEEVAELLADDGGLGEKGEKPLELDQGELATLSIDASGRVVSKLPEGFTRSLDADEKRELENAILQLGKLRRDHAQRLERALVAGRAWRLARFREIFVARNALLGDLASRLVWLAVPEQGATVSFRVPRPGDSGPLEDVFSGALPELGAGTRVRVAHPTELDPDELELWRERFRTLASGARLVQPFPQLFRAVQPEADVAKLARFLGREAYRDDVLELGKKHGLRGLPLRGDGPWELARDFPGRGAVLAFELEPIAAFVLPAKPRREPVKVLDDQDPRAPRAPREAAPRVKVSRVELVGASDPAALAESLAFLHGLTDELTCGTDGFFGDWQRLKFKDPNAAWKVAQDKLALGSGAAVRARLAWLKDSGIAVETKGRFACFAGPLFLDLGTRHAFEGQLCDWVPSWKLDQRIKAADQVALSCPHERDTDEESARIVETAAALARLAPAH